MAWEKEYRSNRIERQEAEARREHNRTHWIAIATPNFGQQKTLIYCQDSGDGNYLEGVVVKGYDIDGDGKLAVGTDDQILKTEPHCIEYRFEEHVTDTVDCKKGYEAKQLWYGYDANYSGNVESFEMHATSEVHCVAVATAQPKRPLRYDSAR